MDSAGFDFQFAEKIDRTQLFQGDLLIRNDALREALEQAHGYYATEPSYSHFMVLTQSCDLVRRGRKPPKSRYITLAAARPLTEMFDKVIEKAKLSAPDEFPLLLCDAAKKTSARQVLERLMHHSESGYFFFQAGSHAAIDTDLCVFLSLSVPIRISHYEACLNAKVLQLDDVFQAKVGWLAGNLYSRVGTPDFEERMPEPIAKTIKDRLYDVALQRTAWLTGSQREHLTTLLAEWREANPGQQLSKDQALDFIERLPLQEALVADHIVNLLSRNKLLPIEVADKAKNLLMSNNALKKLLREGGA